MRRAYHGLLSFILQFQVFDLRRLEGFRKMADEKIYLEKSVETLENGSSLTPPVDHQAGSVQLLDSDHVVLVPTPSQDPKGE